MKYEMRMKKFISLLGACCLALCAVASESPAPSASETHSVSQASATINYSGPAYSAANDGLIPHAASTVQVKWTTDGCSVDGKDGYRVFKVSGGTFSMMINGKQKEMTHYVNYGGERYYFQY